MPFEAVKNRSLADQVFAQLATEIIGGRYQPGSALPSERELAEVFDVNRHVVREALKRLAQASMVRIAQGGHTRVLDYKRHAGLEMLALFAEYAHGHPHVIEHWFAVLEMRASMAADIVRLCALRASPELREDLVAISNQMAASTEVAEVFELEVRFWDRVLDGTGNLAYRLAFNSLVKSVHRMGNQAHKLTVMEVRASGNRQALAQAILAGDAERAETQTRVQMRSQLSMLDKLFGVERPELIYPDRKANAENAEAAATDTTPKRASKNPPKPATKPPASV